MARNAGCSNVPRDEPRQADRGRTEYFFLEPEFHRPPGKPPWADASRQSGDGGRIGGPSKDVWPIQQKWQVIKMTNEIKNIKGPGDSAYPATISIPTELRPARFLTALTWTGMEKALFCDEREHTPDHPIDNPNYKSAKILFVGKNFGSGSSREHAPQAIKRYRD